VEPDDYIQSFFDHIKTQLTGTKVDSGSTSARYRNIIVAAAWTNHLWDVQLHNNGAEPIRRHYDPANARSSESAASYFVDALRAATGQEPLPRPEIAGRPLAGRRKNPTGV